MFNWQREELPRSLPRYMLPLNIESNHVIILYGAVFLQMHSYVSWTFQIDGVDLK